MATQEERLTAVEQKVETLQQKTARAIQEIEENTTIMLGVMRSYSRDIRYIFERVETMEGRLGTIEERLGTMEERLGAVEERVGRMETTLNEHTSLLTQILERLPG